MRTLDALKVRTPPHRIGGPAHQLAFISFIRPPPRPLAPSCSPRLASPRSLISPHRARIPLLPINATMSVHDSKPIDVVWLKRDARLHDHGPLSLVSQSTNPFVVLYLYEPDQLQQQTVHGSHIRFYNEGLKELDNKLSGRKEMGSVDLHAITACYANAVETLTALHRTRPIGRLLAHEETGHFASYQRDRRVRRWCKENGVRCTELNQSGVTRRLRDRDDFSAKLDGFHGRAQYPTPDPAQIRPRLVTAAHLNLPSACGILNPEDISEIPEEHSADREERQSGGEDEALAILDSFLSRRAQKYQKGVSSPNTSWSSCSRLSPYLAWGQISVRRVVQATKQRQAEIKAQRAAGAPLSGDWGRSLGAFLSRMHWRSHFMQKLEDEPLVEKRSMHLAYNHLRKQEGDWNQEYFEAWVEGRTGYPFVDACMRCLIKHGWVNFRMRAMVVSFAAYNLWLDWRRFDAALARLFLDFEPGIHFPQLQMQSGTTGINAMRVYNVTKQSRDQDPTGAFIRKYVPELAKVPNEHIHEPWRMPLQLQRQIKTRITSKRDENEQDIVYYPKPIVEEKQTAKIAKDKVAAVRKQEDSKRTARQVFEKHGSRKGPSDFRSGKSQPSSAKKQKSESSGGQKSITMFAKSTPKVAAKVTKNHAEASAISLLDCDGDETPPAEVKAAPMAAKNTVWTCKACTFENDKPHAPVCKVCGTER